MIVFLFFLLSFTAPPVERTVIFDRSRGDRLVFTDDPAVVRVVNNSYARR